MFLELYKLFFYNKSFYLVIYIKMRNQLNILGIFCLVLVLESTLCEGDIQFLEILRGEVPKETFYYSNTSYSGTLLLELISLSGDCDLYVSQNTLTPTYDPESYCLHSMTCGVDTVIVPKSFKRPIGIGVFGHPSHDISICNLLIYRTEDSKDIFNYNTYEETTKNVHKMEKFKEVIKPRNGDDDNSDDDEDNDYHETSFLLDLIKSFMLNLISEVVVNIF